MKLRTLNIKGYKNLENISLDFAHNNGTSLLVGNNGCGKSNILEAISAIFSALYKDNFTKPKFDFEIDYEINGKVVNVSLNNGKYTIKVDSKSISKSQFTQNKSNLPSRIICCYSGESNRLWAKYYLPYYKLYIDNIKKSDIVPQLPLVYINKYTLNISLLTLFFHDFDVYTDIATFCNDTLNIRTIKNITFDFDSKKIKEWKTNAVLNLAQAISGVDEVTHIPEHKTISLEEFKKNVSSILSNGYELFSRLYGATMPKDDKIISGINFDCELNNGSIITLNDLSEGEKKNLLITTILEVLADENSLILFDEPDSHIHISRKRELKVTLDRYQDKRESILTTHSPSLASAFNNADHIIGLGVDENNKAKIIEKSATDLISELTNGIWNVHQQNIFLASNKPIILFVEGETDKIIIEEAYKRLNNDYPLLRFDVFHCSGADNIPQLLIGLNTSDLQWGKKKIIAIFDSDKEGNDNCNKTRVKYSKAKNKRGLYAITLPKKNATIENFFQDSRFNEAYKEALLENPFSGSVKDFAHKVLIKAKIKLSEDCKRYPDYDFDEFKILFDTIEEIYQL